MTFAMIMFGSACSSKEASASDTDTDKEEVEVKQEKSVESKNLALLKDGIRDANKMFPVQTDEATVMKKIYLDGDYVMYLSEVDEDLMDMDLFEEGKSGMRDYLKSNLTGITDANFRQFKNICIKANKGIGYKYVGDTSGKGVVIKFSCDELRDM